MITGRFRFGEFEFDRGTGELSREPASGVPETQRLSPKPAALLALLLEAGGELVTRDLIRERLWPDVEVEFDRSLHFCVRQVRSALGDSASGPRYVENVPRRGYRLIPPVERIGPIEPGAESPVRPAFARSWRPVAALALVATVAAVVALTGPGWNIGPEPRVRVGVMPFRPPPGQSRFGDTGSIAETILEALVFSAGERAGIVGPTTTAGFEDSSASLRRLGEEYRLDYIVNGRFVADADGERMLAELIRVSDGAHVWVRSYDAIDEGRRIGSEIGRNVIRELGWNVESPGE